MFEINVMFVIFFERIIKYKNDKYFIDVLVKFLLSLIFNSFEGIILIMNILIAFRLFQKWIIYLKYI